MANNSVWALYRLRNRINSNPEYQRQSDIWTLEKQQLLIDTILNKFDVPKIYLHKYTRTETVDDNEFDYSIIDGKQRLHTIWDFIVGKFKLSEDFEYFSDLSVNAKGMTYQEISSKYPDIKADFDSFQLVTVEIQTDDNLMIEEMFSRLNEAVPLNAPEKRNAYGGPIPKLIREICGLSFFTDKIPYPDKRYRHYDLATKFLYIESNGKILDTKKVYLDKFVQNYASNQGQDLAFSENTRKILGCMCHVFEDKDVMLRSTGMTMVYYYLFKQAVHQNWVETITRAALAEFDELRLKNRDIARSDISSADYDLLEFDKYAQSPNDKYAMEIRLKILLKNVFDRKCMEDIEI